MLDPRRLKGAIAEKIQRKQDRTALLTMAAPTHAFTSKPQKKMYRILAEGVTLMGRQTDDWTKDTPKRQKKFLEKTRRILGLPYKKYSDNEALESLVKMNFFFAYVERTLANTSQLIAHTQLLGGSDKVHGQLMKDLKETLNT